MATYSRPHYSDPHPLLLLVTGPQVLRTMQQATGLPPAALLVLLAVDVVGQETQANVRAADLQTGFISPGLLRSHVRTLAGKGYLARQQVSRRRGRVLVLTAAGASLVSELRRELRQATRQLVPAACCRWPGR